MPPRLRARARVPHSCVKSLGGFWGLLCAFRVFAAAGEVDVSFSSPLTTNHFVWSVAEQNDGKLIVGGAETVSPGLTRAFLLRLFPTGRLDKSFRVRFEDALNVMRVRLRNDGAIVALGQLQTLNRLAPDFISSGNGPVNVTVLNAHGRPLRAYRPERDVTTPWNAAIAPDGTVYFEGFSGLNGIIRSLDRNGNTNAPIVLPRYFTPWTLRVLDDGTLVGTWTEYPSGSYLLNTFIPLRAGGVVDVMMGRSNTLYYIGSLALGDTSGVWRKGVVRTSRNGALDASFNFAFPGVGTNYIFTTNPYAGWTVLSIARDAQERLTYAAYYREDYGMPITYHVARVLSDGSEDATFDAGTGADGATQGVLRTRDGGVLVWGGFVSFNGMTSPGLARLKSE